MTWPLPQTGLVVAYSYLWHREANTGHEEGRKDRPCAVIMAVKSVQGDTTVYVLPITHSAPLKADEGLEIPAPTKARLGLDEARSWVVLNEANVFVWPGPDLRLVQGQSPSGPAYGILPPGFFRVLRERFLTLANARRIRTVKRTP